MLSEPFATIGQSGKKDYSRLLRNELSRAVQRISQWQTACCEQQLFSCLVAVPTSPNIDVKQGRFHFLSRTLDGYGMFSANAEHAPRLTRL